nr:hypothetical protein [Tanacetum cinerariifolium]
MRRVGKGFSGVETPLFEEIVAEDVSHDAIPSPLSHDIPSPSQEPSSPLQQPHKLEFVKLKARVKKLEKTNKGRMMNEDKGFELVLSMQEDDSEVQDVVEVVTTAKLITDVVTAAASQVSTASATIPAASASISAAKPSIPTAALTVVAAYTKRRKRVIIRDPEEELSLKTSAETPGETLKVKDKGKGIMVETPKPMKKKDQIELDAKYARKLHEEINKDDAEFNKDIDWDAATDHSREEMEEEDEEIIKSINETPAQKAAKRRKLNEEAQEAEALKKQLEIVNDEDDDVFTEATLLGRKVPVVDYEIVMINNKPRIYPNPKFTLEQLVNVARLQVEEESEMSLELLRLKLKLFKDIAAAADDMKR